MPGLLDVINQIGRGAERIYNEQMGGAPTGLLTEQPIYVPYPKDNVVMDYFNTYVGPEELGKSDKAKYYDKERNMYKVYQVGKEERPTVGMGVYLDDKALRELGIKKIPTEGSYISADAVDNLTQRRWVEAYEQATKELAGTKGESSIGPLSEMIYQMGAGVITPGSKKYFKNTLKFLKQGKVEEAQKLARKSNWYRQTPDRAKRVINRFGGGDL